MTELSYELRRPDVVSEEIEGEVVVVHLVKGLYYSLQGSAAAIWEQLLLGVPVREVSERLAPRYSVERPLLEQAVVAFAEQVLSEGLLVARTAPPSLPPARHHGRAEDFQAPVLERFDDMQELLVLDPIHEVDESAGWPHRRAV
ncbi:MAG: PqqD family protein [Vulcanimicrobiota bacterium]